MFGHDDKDHDKDANPDQNTAVATETVQDNSQDDSTTAITDTDAGTDQIIQDTPQADDQAQAPAEPVTDENAWQHPGEPLDKEAPEPDTAPEPINDIIAPAGGSKPTAPPHLNFPEPSFSSDDNPDANVSHELIDIKQKALTELVPLIDKLDQEPEDRFRTLMMMIQASDDQKLIKEAYESAESIDDEKTRGQALLDIVNEINYFTQHPEI